jgi:hypothetical protein
VPYGKYTIHLSFVQLMVRCVYPPPVLRAFARKTVVFFEFLYNYIYKRDKQKRVPPFKSRVSLQNGKGVTPIFEAIIVF